MASVSHIGTTSFRMRSRSSGRSARSDTMSTRIPNRSSRVSEGYQVKERGSLQKPYQQVYIAPSLRFSAGIGSENKAHKPQVAVQVGGDAASERPIRFQKCLARSVFQTEFSGQGMGSGVRDQE